MNQTPYSIYFSIRKKFLKSYDPSAPDPSTQQSDPSLSNLKSEYQHLYGCYQTALANENILISEVARLKNELENKSELEEAKQKNEVKNKALVKELCDIKAKYDKKCAEAKTLKDVVDDVKKENNSASVALKRSKKEQNETVKRFEKKIHDYENKITDLMEFKNKIINEKRDLKLQQRKEIKKAKQLVKKELESDKNKNIEKVDKTFDRKENFPAPSSPFSLCLTPHATTGTSTNGEATNNEHGEASHDEFKQEENDINSNIENKEVSKDKLMSKEEREVFFAKLSEDFKNKLDEINKPLLENLKNMRNGDNK